MYSKFMTVICNQLNNIPQRLIHATYARHFDSLRRHGIIKGGKKRLKRDVIMFTASDPSLGDQSGYDAGVRDDADMFLNMNLPHCFGKYVFWIADGNHSISLRKIVFVFSSMFLKMFPDTRI